MKTIKWQRTFVPALFLSFNAISITGCVGIIGDSIDDEEIAHSEDALTLWECGVYDIETPKCSAVEGAIADIRLQADEMGPDRRQVIERGLEWFGEGIMYNAVGTEPKTGYRTDCSGFVSMAWSIEPKPGRSTAWFPPRMANSSYARVIGIDELAPGDAVNRICPNCKPSDKGHIMLFAGWATPDHNELYFLHHSAPGKPILLKRMGRKVFDTFVPIRSFQHELPPPPESQAPESPAPPVNPNPPTPTGEMGMPVPPPMRLQLAGPKRIADREIYANTEEIINVLDTGIPTSEVHAAVLNLVVDKPDGVGYGQVWAAEGTKPTTSDINFMPGETRANLIVVRVNSSGLAKVQLTTTGKARMVVDVVGYFAASGTMGFLPVQQRRVLGSPVSVPAQGTLDVNLGISPSVAAISLTAVGTSSPGYLAAYRTGKAFDGSFSTLNYGVNQDIANQAWVEPNNGSITIYNDGGSPVSVLVDINAAFDTTSNTGFVPFATPARAYDTRDPKNGALPPNWTTQLYFGAANVPDNAIGLAYNMTMIQPYSGGYGALHATNWWPGTSVVNFVKDHDVASGGVTLMGDDHQIRVTNGPAITHMAMDVAGYFVNP